MYIAQIKKKCGLDVDDNFNLAKSENVRQTKCTPEREDAIMQAFWNHIVTILEDVLLQLMCVYSR